MANSQHYTALIVCKDRRGEILADLLQGWTIYLYTLNNKKNWQWVEIIDESIDEVTESSIQKKTSIDVLFFHKGDANKIPSDIMFTKEFYFSGGSIGTTNILRDREQAIPIERPFTSNNCPIKKRHISQIKEFVDGKSTENPAFCRRDNALPALWALAIVIKTYTLAGVGCHAIERNSQLIQELGWDKREWDIITVHSPNASHIWQEAQSKKWWGMHLGYWDVSKNTVDVERYQEFLSRLIVELEVDDLARRELKLTADTELINTSSDKLIEFIKSLDKSVVDTKNILDLLGIDNINIELVTSAYSEISKLLANR